MRTEGKNRNPKMKRKRKPKAPKLLSKRMKNRLTLVLGVFGIFLIWIMYNIFVISHDKGESYSRIVLSQQRYDSLEIPYRRGDILDRNGTYLATCKKVYNVILEPKHILANEDKKEVTVTALTKYFPLTVSEIEEMLKDSTSLYKIALRGQEYETIQRFNEYKSTEDGRDIVGVWFEEEYKRYYPLRDLACHVIGFSASGNVGQGGIESEYNSTLNGVNGRQYGYLKGDMSMESTTISAKDGNTVVSSIDANIQQIIEKHVDTYMEDIGALNVSVLAMNPQNGEILGLCNSHKFDLNNPRNEEALLYQFRGKESEKREQIENLTDDEKLEALNQLWRNNVVNDTFEPGSTYKTFTVAAALEENVLKGNETFVCDGGEQVSDYYIHCHNRDGHGTLTVAQALSKSCNDALMQIVSRIGRNTFSKYQTVFGFGLKTNVDLPGEAYTKNLIYDKEGLNAVELACSAFGQGLNVSMIQLATAFCSVVNGGDYYQPHVVKQILAPDGTVVKNVEGVVLRKTISASTCEKLKEYLLEVVQSGTAATRGHIDGYSIGGKTGTAEKIPRNKEKYILSFICAVPMEAPELVLYVTVDEPHLPDPSHSGIATVVAKDILEDLLPYMNIFKTNDDAVDMDAAEEPEAVAPIFDGDAPEESPDVETPEADE